MANALGVLGKQLVDIWHQFGVNQKVSTAMGLAVTVGIVGGLLYWTSIPSYALLYSEMALKDAAAAREKLEDERIPVKLKDSGHSIYVPAADVYRGRLILAREGLPKDTSTGFELFEQPKFGLTDFAQKINFRRALQGELERTISAMEGINSARIQLVQPKEKLFASQAERKAKASIMLHLVAGVLTQSQAKSIKHLVASAVSGLNASAIVITDQHGNLYSRAAESGEEFMEAATGQIESQEKVERLLTQKAQDMLDAALGPTQSIVRVSVELDFSKIEKRTENYLPEGRVVVSETISSETTSSPGGFSAGEAMGSVTVKSPERVTPEQSMSKTKREDISTQYKVPSDVEHVVKKGARIKSLSISVCVSENEENKRTPEEMASISNMVKTAVGFTESGERKDSIRVVQMAFPAVTKKETKTPFWQKLPIPVGSIANGLIAILVLIVLFVASRRLLTRLSVEREEVGVPVGSMAEGGREIDVGMTGTGSIESNLDQVTRLAEQNPRAIAAWITNISKGQG